MLHSCFVIPSSFVVRASSFLFPLLLCPSCRNSDGQRPEVCPNVVRPVTCFEIAGLPRELFERFTLGEGKPQIPSPVNRIAPKPSRLTNRSPILRLKRQQHPRDLLPKTFFVSSQLKYVAAIDSQLRKGAWLQRSFTLSPVRQGTNPPWRVGP